MLFALFIEVKSLFRSFKELTSNRNPHKNPFYCMSSFSKNVFLEIKGIYAENTYLRRTNHQRLK